jgi:hypothetical protein
LDTSNKTWYIPYHLGFYFFVDKPAPLFSWFCGRVVPTVLGTQPIHFEAHTAILVNENMILVIVSKGAPLVDSIWFLEVSRSKFSNSLVILPFGSVELLSKTLKLYHTLIWWDNNPFFLFSCILPNSWSINERVMPWPFC